MASDIEKDIRKLKSSAIAEKLEALIKIQNYYLQNQAEIKKITKNFLVESIVSLMEHPKFSIITLNIIAEGCLELDFVNEIIKCNGIRHLVKIMKSHVNDDIKNRACRALSNIVQFDTGYKAVHLMKPISSVVNFLSKTSDVHYQITAVDTLMALGKSSKAKELISQENGFKYIINLLHSPDIQVLICSVRALAKLTYNCNISCARQLLELNCHKILIELYPHSEECVRNYSLISLKNLSSFEEQRTALVKAGGVKLFVEVLSSNELHEKSRFAVLALCKCLDHFHMWSHNGIDRAMGLKALLDVLKNQYFQDIHISVISSLIPLSYEVKTASILFSLDVLKILFELLNTFVNMYKCKSADRYMYDQHSDCKLNKGNETELVYDPLYEKQSGNDLLKDNKQLNKWDSSMYGLSSATSDYCGSSSPIPKYSSSPEYNYDIDVGSPSGSHISSGVWSPVSLADESMPNHLTCWSPVISNCSTSVIPESEKNEATVTGDFSLIENFNSSVINYDSSLLQSYTVNERENLLKNLDHEYSDFSESVASRKKLKTNPSNNITPVELQMNVKVLNTSISSNSKNNVNSSYPGNASKVSSNFSVIVNKKTETKNDSINSINSESIFYDNEQSSYLKLLNENVEHQTIDHYVIFFILQLSFHIGKETNSQMANKSFFSILIDYLCLIHMPSLKAESVLLNLIKSRYCLEKVIANGFFCELEEKMNMQNNSCTHHCNVKRLYSNLITVARQEVDSDYGIGTLLGIIRKSSKNAQLHSVHAMSTLVTKKLSLHKLFLNTNFLSLLLNFLQESDVKIRKKAVLALCEMYQSLTKLKKAEKCCFAGSCVMKTSTKCFYKESFLDVTFSVSGGGKILANREKICENSSYFKALLQGHFQESNTALVVMPHISAENLSTIFHFLHGCGKANLTCPYITRIPLSVLLELLRDSEKFLLEKIKSFVEDQLCHRLLPSAIPRIYKASKIHNSPALARKSLSSALRIDSFQKDVIWNCFKELSMLEPIDNINLDINNLFKKLLLD